MIKLLQVKKIKPISITLLTAVSLYTIFGIYQLGKKGGPCNAGIVIIVLIPSLLICLGLLASTFKWVMPTKKTNHTIPITLSIISLLIWTSWFILLGEAEPLYVFIYLGFFELLILLFLAYFISQSIQVQKLKYK